MVYLTASDFLQQNLGEQRQLKTLWLKDYHQQAAQQIFGHRYRGLRIRYWQQAGTTAWILDEIGKDLPITIGIVIDDDKIRRLSILEFRESRGGEVRHPFFTRQFDDLWLKPDYRLSGSIDGISGATLSVRAVSKVSRFALFLQHSLKRDLVKASVP
ncbi:MAG: FMN-binding protein [Pseudomonadales bacterium]|nr:FMN-binding protein [Pseudomonadales bacterium]